MDEAANDRALLADAWNDAARDLAIEVTPLYRTESGHEFAALVRRFGSSKGMLVLENWDEERMAAAAAEGFGYSCLGASYTAYDRANFIELLRDWTWTGPSSRLPSWYPDAI